jgi:hypothetical protein
MQQKGNPHYSEQQYPCLSTHLKMARPKHVVNEIVSNKRTISSARGRKTPPKSDWS